MILIDTSVWVDHLRRGDARLTAVLESDRAAIHPFVIGELACGNLKARKNVLDLLRALPMITVATDEEVLLFIEHHRLMGRGIGYVDAHLLTATAVNGSANLWTRDKALAAVATDIGLAHIGDKREGKH